VKRKLLDAIVAEELDHIEKGTNGSDQNALRMVYNTVRRRDLGRNPDTPRTQSLLRAIEAVREGSPGFAPLYHKDYFKS
jgi:hypothetical protein